MNDGYDNLYNQGGKNDRQLSNRSLKGRVGSAYKTAGTATKAAGTAATTVGATTNALGKGTEMAGKGIQKGANTLGDAASKIPVIGGALGAGIKGAGNAVGGGSQKLGQAGQNAGQKTKEKGNELKNKGNDLQKKGNDLQSPANGLQKAGKGTKAVGKAAKVAGKGIKAAGKGAEIAGKGMDKAGKGIKTASKAVGTAVQAIPIVGTAIGAGIKAAGTVAGTAVQVAGKGAQAAGKAGKVAGKATEAAGKGVEVAGKGVEKAGKAAKEVANPTESVGGKVKGIFKVLIPVGVFVLINFPLIFLLMVLVGDMIDESSGSGTSSSVSAASAYDPSTAGNISSDLLGFLQKPVNISGEVEFTGNDAFGTSNGSVQKGVVLTHTNSGINVGDDVYSVYDGKIVGIGRSTGESSGNSANVNTFGGGNFTKYSLSDEQILEIASQCQAEQGSVEGAKAEASLMANRYELFGNKEKYPNLHIYVKTQGWWSNSESHMNARDARQEIVDAVKDVLVNGNRVFPIIIDQHDCIDCYGRCENGNKGDICSLTNSDGHENKDMSYIKNRNNYIQNETVILSRYKEHYTFYSFPTSSSDPFGYTQAALRKANVQIENDSNWIKIEHTINDTTFYSVYKYLGSITDGYEVGTTVRKGEVIGKVGTVNGRSEASLYFGMEDAINTPINPSNLFKNYSATPGTGSDFIWPCSSLVIEDHFGDRSHEIKEHPESYPSGSTTDHFAIDIDTNEAKIPFYAIGPGTIESIATTGVHSIILKLDATTSEGDPIYVRYTHGDAVSGLRVGTHLEKGGQIGTANGHPNFDVHLDFSTYIVHDGKEIWQNPLIFLYGLSYDGSNDRTMRCNIYKPDGSLATSIRFDNYDGEIIDFQYLSGTFTGYSNGQYTGVNWNRKN